jgi:hypothetical protein
MRRPSKDGHILRWTYLTAYVIKFTTEHITQWADLSRQTDRQTLTYPTPPGRYLLGVFIEQYRQVLVDRYQVLQWPGGEEFPGATLAQEVPQCPVRVPSPNQVPWSGNPGLIGLMEPLASQVPAARRPLSHCQRRSASGAGTEQRS